ncbi:MAG: ATP synthase F1 subunit delta [Parcubacteria group bacterium]|jgi:F-type H+-transporting ATPase subunit delta
MRITARQLAETLFELTDRKSESEAKKNISQFADFVVKKKKLKELGKIIENFGKYYNLKNGVVEADVITAEKIEAKTLKNIGDYVKRNSKAEKIILRNEIDKGIKGGFIVKVNDEIWNASIKGKLEALKKAITT